MGWSEMNDRQKKKKQVALPNRDTKKEFRRCVDHLVQDQSAAIQNQAFRFLLASKNSITIPCLSQND